MAMKELENSCGVEMLYPNATCDVRALTELLLLLNSSPNCGA